MAAKGTNKLGNLTEALVKALIERYKKDPDGRETLTGLLTFAESKAPERIHISSPSTWYRALRLSSARALIGRDDPVGVDTVNEAVPSLTRLYPALREEVPQEQSEEAWVEFLELIIQTVKAGGQIGPPEPVVPDWRIVERSADVDEVSRLLEENHAVCIYGMSGSGKTILARQVADRLRGQGATVAYVDARQSLKPVLSAESNPKTDDFIVLIRELLRAVVRSAPALQGYDSKRKYAKAADEFRSQWEREFAADPDENDLSKRYQSEFFVEAGEALKWRDLGKAISGPTFTVRNISLLRDLAKLVRAAVGPVIVVIDDLWGTTLEVQEVLAALFHSSAEALKPKLLVTSLERECVSYLERSAIFDIERRGEGAPEFDEPFAVDLLARVAAPIKDDMSFDLAMQTATDFRSRHFATGEALKPIRPILTRLRGHPLAITVLATAWKEQIDNTVFWQTVSASMDEHAQEWLTLYKNRRTSFVTDLRHYDVLGALSFGWNLLSPRDRDRYLDLVLLPTDGTVCAPLFARLWSNVERGDPRDGVAPAVLPMPFRAELEPIRIFVRTSVLIEEIRDGILCYRLHDLYRLWLEYAVERSHRSRAERHADLLLALGFGNAAGEFHLDEENHFETHGGRRKLVASRVAGASERDAGAVNAYLIRNIRRHAEAAAPLEQSAQRQGLILSCYSYLQARLDVIDDTSMGDKKGNIDNLSSDFEALLSDKLTPLRDALERAKSTLAEDRTQLAGQLLARTEVNEEPLLIALKAGSVRYAPKPCLLPRFPFLNEQWSRVISTFPLLDPRTKAGFEWILEPPVGPAMLRWMNGSISVFDLISGTKRRLLPMVHIGLEGVMFVNDAGGAPAILSWSNSGEIKIWDALSGRLRNLEPIPALFMRGKPEWLVTVSGKSVILCRASWGIFFRDGVTGVSLDNMKFSGREYGKSGIGVGQWAGRIRIWDRHKPEPPDLVTGANVMGFNGEELRATGIANGRWAGRILMWDETRIWLLDPETGTNQLVSFLQWPDTEEAKNHNWVEFAVCGDGDISDVIWVDDAQHGAAIVAMHSKGVCVWREGFGLDQDESVVSDENSRTWKADWITNVHGGPAILSWADNIVHLSKLGGADAEFRHAHSVVGAIWLEACARVVSWTTNDMFMWDPLDPSNAVALRHTGEILGVRPDMSATGYAVAMSWACVEDRSSWLYQWSATGSQVGDPIFLEVSKTLDIQPVQITGEISALLTHSPLQAQLLKPLDAERQSASWQHPSPIYLMQWISADGIPPFVLTGSGNGLLRAWDGDTGKQRFESMVRHDGAICDIEWIEDAFGTSAVLVASDDGRVSLCAFPGGKEIIEKPFIHNAGLCGAKWIASGFSSPAIFSWGQYDSAEDQSNGRLGLWDARTGTILYELAPVPRLIGARCFIDHRGAVAVAAWTRGDTIMLWHPRDDLLRSDSRAAQRYGVVRSIEPVVHDGVVERYFSWANDGTIALWSTEPNVNTPIFRAHHPVQELMGAQWLDNFDGDPALVTWGEDSICFWRDTNTDGRAHHVIKQGDNKFDPIIGLIWLRDKSETFGAISWTLYGSIYVYDYDLRPIQFEHPIRHYMIISLRWIGYSLGFPAAISHGHDDTVRIWNLAEAKEVACFRIRLPIQIEFLQPSLDQSEPSIVVGTVGGEIGILRYVPR